MSPTADHEARHTQYSRLDMQADINPPELPCLFVPGISIKPEYAASDRDIHSVWAHDPGSGIPISRHEKRLGFRKLSQVSRNNCKFERINCK